MLASRLYLKEWMCKEIGCETLGPEKNSCLKTMLLQFKNKQKMVISLYLYSMV